MSWIVRELLVNADNIRRSIVDTDYTTVSFQLEDNQYNDLLEIEKAIAELVEGNQINKTELNIITALEKGFTYRQIAKEYNIASVNTVKTIVHHVCSRVAFKLGGKFTDDGFVDYMTTEYKLDDEQITKLRGLI